MYKYKIMFAVKSDRSTKKELDEMVKEFLLCLCNFGESASENIEYGESGNCYLVFSLESEIETTSTDIYSLYTSVKDHIPIVLVNIQDAKYAYKSDKYYWYNEGATTYKDNSTYTDNSYKLFIDGRPEYTIIDLEKERLKKYCPTKYFSDSYKDVKFVWEETASWDNKLEATTLEEAIEVLEKIHFECLWKTVENLKESVSKAINNYRDFFEYRKNKN